MQVNRTEQKILIDYKQAVDLKHRLGLIMPVDEHSTSADGYEVRSMYFDTVSDRCCMEKEDGLLVHEKIRVRCYGTNRNIIKLECKRKIGEHQVKKTMLINEEILGNIIRCDYSDLIRSENPMGMYFYEKLSNGMFPKCIIQYKRLSYCLPTNNIRITFDSDIRATECSFDLFQEPLNAHPILPMNKVILEVKYNNFLFDYIKDALRGVEKSPGAFSKYMGGRSFYGNVL